MLGRVCGLMSEPSYFGAFAALFGLPLLLMKSYYRLRYRLLGIFLLVAAVFAQAKTMFIVIFFQLIILFIYTKNFNFKKIFIVFGALFVFGLLYLISVGQNINVNENLSAAMRFGSTILGFNVASQGYAITGLGFGQFHFYYNPQFAPNFLLLSDEANYQFQSHAETRASTYNFFIRILVEAGIVDLVAELTLLSEIEPDPSLYAGGLSMMFYGDFLNPHIDNSHDSDRNRYRRLNLLYYVSPDWKIENGGNFELWDRDRVKQKTITAKTNRLVVMETNKTSWHSVSKITIDKPRCCVSNYYFSKNSPDSTEYFHVTSFSGRPDERIKRFIGITDNALRNFAAKILKIGRGKKLINKDTI